MTETIDRPNSRVEEQPFDLDLVRRTVAKGATNDELALYLHDCQRRGVHPLDRLLHFTIREDKGVRKYTPIVSIDFFRSQAADTGEHAGTDDAVYVTDDGALFPASATVTVYRLKGGVRCPFTATARWTEYRPAKDFMWQKMPYTMLGKCAEALALRKGFPRELAGLYTHDEMAQAGPPIDPAMTVEANGGAPADVARANVARSANPQPVTAFCTQRQREVIGEIASELGIGQDYWPKVMKQHNVKRLGNLTEAQAAEVVLELSQFAVDKLLTELALNLDDVRMEDSSVAADVPGELDQAQADAALIVLRRCKANAVNA